MSLRDKVAAEKGMTRQEIDEYMRQWKNAKEFEYDVFPGTMSGELPVWHIDVYRRRDEHIPTRLVQAWTTRRTL